MVTEDNLTAMRDELGTLIRTGDLTYRHTIHHGFDQIPTAYQSLYPTPTTPPTQGKALVKL